MDRKLFLKNSLGLAGVAVAVPIISRAENFLKPAQATGTVLEETIACTVTNTETEGPFPTKSPSTLVKTDIIGDRTGVAFTINITVQNTNTNCSVYAGAIVDIWHCDKDGNYSEYGGTQMQTTNYTAYHFLRGRQTTNANGQVSFTSIFPGWYTSRATHIHVHIYKPDGTSLLVTQIAFPEGSNSAVVLVNSATAYGYTKGMTGYTYNASDNVFSDGVSTEMSTVTGSVSGGFTLSHTINVAGPALATNEVNDSKNFKVEQNYPNPFREETIFPIVLKERSSVSIDLYELSGRKVCSVISKQTLSSGEQKIKMSRNQLKAGFYIAKINVENSSGYFTENLKVLVK